MNDYQDLLWLTSLLDEVGLQKFQTKITNELQVSKWSHFDFVKEDDLIHLGMSRPAAKRLLAAIKKRKSFVTALKNRIVNKLIPINSLSGYTTCIKNKNNHDLIGSFNSTTSDRNSDLGRLTCLINSQDIQIKEEIGRGVHGFVKKGEWTTPNGRVVEVALKILRKDVMSEPGASFNDFVKEINVMHQSNHPNILKLYGVVLSSPMMMVTELAPFGNLRDKLRSENGNTPISQIINFGVQIASGMEYLESRRFVHRDLAARNIFISHGKKILIGDLGLMRVVPIKEDHYVMSEKTKLPYPWCAPESLRLKQFSSYSDVYMFGVTMWEMFSFGKEPWANLNLNEILENISSQNKRLPCPEACPAMVYQTLLQCWNVNPSSRPNFSTLYQYLSTSYPLEVRSTQHISEIGQKRLNGDLLPNNFSDLSSSSSSSSPDEQNSFRKPYRKVLTCQVDDRILVIDGQPEKYWWKGQNQRNFEIGWFPLCSTRWLAPKKGSAYISKPLKNSFIHSGHCGRDGKWGSPKFIDHMYLQNPLEPEDLNSFNANRSSEPQFSGVKTKTKSRLSRFFGITDNSSSSLLPSSYQKFNNDSKNILIRTTNEQLPIIVSKAKVDDEPPLIDLSDDNSNLPVNSIAKSDDIFSNQESILDMETPFANVFGQKHSSDPQLNIFNDVNNYRGSWAGSWNTGTFYSSNCNIYSSYYCPQDADANLATSSKTEFDTVNRYYSTVTSEDSREAPN